MNTPRHLVFLLALVGLTLLSSCKEEPTVGNLSLNITHAVDGAELALNQQIYTNEAGYQYDVSTLVYYISNIRLEGDGEDFVDTRVHYIDIEDLSTQSITLENVPFGNYNRIRFNLGVDAARNVTGGLENTTINNNMAWPDMMGGGYHHMKLEGNYTNGVDPEQGFAMHLGKQGNEADCVQNRSFAHTEDGTAHTLTMNINEWFRGPNVYDFEVDGTAIMANDAALQKLSENGDDVFDN